MDISQWLPMPPFLGPPLPAFLNIRWPWAQQQTTAALSSPLSNVFGAINNTSSSSAPAYENEERVSFPDGFDPETFMPRTILIHRRYKKRVE